MTDVMTYPAAAAAITLAHLRAAGRSGVECIVLWLGRRTPGGWTVEEAYRPEHRARADQFLIPPSSMAALHDHLRANRRMVVAQVHSHPERAFHSRADDAGALVRHLGALSLVIPYFGLRTPDELFLEHAAVYRLSEANRWQDATQRRHELCRST